VIFVFNKAFVRALGAESRYCPT